MNFEILTLFPALMEQICAESIVGRACKAGFISVHVTDIRDFSQDRRRRVDDTPYGGGFGMVLACQPVLDCLRAVRARLTGSVRVLYPSPQGKVFTHEKACEFRAYDNLILLCGHYEGIDERILELGVDEEVSIGNYVLTGGELPAAVIVDAVARLVDGVLASDTCYEDESIASGLLEHPQYTRPRTYEGLSVPAVLLDGVHADITAWKKAKALERTLAKRPDLITPATLTQLADKTDKDDPT